MAELQVTKGADTKTVGGLASKGHQRTVHFNDWIPGRRGADRTDATSWKETAFKKWFSLIFWKVYHDELDFLTDLHLVKSKLSCFPLK
jgi:hypothetical protein